MKGRRSWNLKRNPKTTTKNHCDKNFSQRMNRMCLVTLVSIVLNIYHMSWNPACLQSRGHLPPTLSPLLSSNKAHMHLEVLLQVQLVSARLHSPDHKHQCFLLELLNLLSCDVSSFKEPVEGGSWWNQHSSDGFQPETKRLWLRRDSGRLIPRSLRPDSKASLGETLRVLENTRSLLSVRTIYVTSDTSASSWELQKWSCGQWVHTCSTIYAPSDRNGSQEVLEKTNR